MKPLLIGMYTLLASHNMTPAPEDCVGHQLWQMLHARTKATKEQYLACFEGRNLIRGPEWDRLTARARAYEVVCELRDSGRTVVLLGNSVREAFDWALSNEVCKSLGDLARLKGFDILTTSGLPPLLVHPQLAGGCTWRQIPHPSGRNLYYNDPENRKVVELLMEELYVEYTRRKNLEAAD